MKNKRSGFFSLDISLAFILVCLTMAVAVYAFESNAGQLDDALQRAFLERRAITTADWLVKHCSYFAACDGDGTVFSHLVSESRIAGADAKKIANDLGLSSGESLELRADKIEGGRKTALLEKRGDAGKNRACVKRFARLGSPEQVDEPGLPMAVITVCVGK